MSAAEAAASTIAEHIFGTAVPLQLLDNHKGVAVYGCTSPAGWTLPIAVGRWVSHGIWRNARSIRTLADGVRLHPLDFAQHVQAAAEKHCVSPMLAASPKSAPGGRPPTKAPKAPCPRPGAASPAGKRMYEQFGRPR